MYRAIKNFVDIMHISSSFSPSFYICAKYFRYSKCKRFSMMKQTYQWLMLQCFKY